jgi:hypothetical protein
MAPADGPRFDDTETGVTIRRLTDHKGHSHHL